MNILLPSIMWATPSYDNISWYSWSVVKETYISCDTESTLKKLYTNQCLAQDPDLSVTYTKQPSDTIRPCRSQNNPFKVHMRSTYILSD